MRTILALSISMLLASATVASATVNVVTSIKPIHSLVASIMQGTGEPGLLVTGNNSPHTYALKPNDAKALQAADVVFWVGPELEAFLERPLNSLATNAKSVRLMNSPGLQTLPIREGNGFDKDDDGDAAGTKDAHIWLDPENAKAISATIASVLAEQDPTNAAIYKSNAEKLTKQIDVMSKEISAEVSPIKGKGFIVFHDAYHYFEHRFGLRASGAISLHPESTPGAKAIADIRQRIADGKVTCVFAEPQFDNALISSLLEGTTVKASTLDPEGATEEPGPALYETVMRNISRNLSSCLQ